jgi:hypothetical protein
MEKAKILKPKIFIASSSRTLTLAKELRENLQTDYCEATLWSDEDRSQPSATIDEMLDRAILQYDFAAVILARDDIIIRGRDDASARRSRDNCVFEAGLFMAALGRNRCYIINSVKNQDLPSDFGGMISIPFDEPANLTDTQACSQAITTAATVLLRTIKSEAWSAPHAVRFLSDAEIFHRERLDYDGGYLREGGSVVVYDTQPMAGVELSLQIRHNIDAGISYYDLIHFGDDSVEKLCQSLQVILVAGVGGTEKATDFKSRIGTIMEKQNEILDDLQNICHSRHLVVSFFRDEPHMCFRIHNANSPALAQLYARHQKFGFILWLEGRGAVSIWERLPALIADNSQDRLFVPLSFLGLNDDNKKHFERSLDNSLSRYFPGIEGKVKKLCIGDYL